MWEGRRACVMLRACARTTRAGGLVRNTSPLSKTNVFYWKGHGAAVAGRAVERTPLSNVSPCASIAAVAEL